MKKVPGHPSASRVTPSQTSMAPRIIRCSSREGKSGRPALIPNKRIATAKAGITAKTIGARASTSVALIRSGATCIASSYSLPFFVFSFEYPDFSLRVKGAAICARGIPQHPGFASHHERWRRAV